MFGSGSEKNVKASVDKKNEEARSFILSENSVINGNVSTNEQARVGGTIEGSLSVENSLYIGPKGAVSGPVFCQVAVIDGAVNGNVVCKGAVRLSATAKVTGDLQCTSLVMEPGVYFCGKVICVAPEQPKAEETVVGEAGTEQ